MRLEINFDGNKLKKECYKKVVINIISLYFNV
jgi:hypothetical protein